jgi:transglutaminase-like putative cysteine protease
MSRQEHSPAVEAPRPAAAWLMSLVASGTLWATEQLPLWIIAVQCLVFGVSFATRANPPAFRKNALWLNVFMLGITTVTIRSALDGNPATISLAYFTALAQGLQLLDARPRKSEFVLVALALFQVILASNLTDSIFFPPLVLVFLATVTWTLLVHTLSMEAAEAGDPAALSSALAPDLRRMTIVATTACLALAVVLFVLFPRLKTNIFRGGAGSGLAISGFSDRVELGTVGQIRKDHSLVLRVEGLEGDLPAPENAYWRGLAFDEFDGRHWSISRSERIAARRAISGVGRFGIDIRPRDGSATFAQRIIREPVEAGVLFVPGDVQRIEGSFQRLESDRNGGLYLPARGNDRIRYTVWSKASQNDAEALRRDRARPPMEPSPGGERPADRYLQLTELEPRVHAFAAQIVEGAANDFDRAWQIQEDLRRSGRYTDSPPPLGDEMTSPIEAFLLGELEGHCEYFASAMVALARSQGLPTRLVNGFAGGVSNEMGGFVEVTQADAHAWVEIHFEKAGWVRFDPTPPDLRLRANHDISLWAQLGQVGSAVELWWFQRVVDFDSVDQIGVLRGLWLSWTERRSNRPSPTNDLAKSKDSKWIHGLADRDSITFLAGILTALAMGIALWRRRRNQVDSVVPAAYRKALNLLARRGLIRADSASARDFARGVEEQLPGTGSTAFAEITNEYLAERFGRHEAADLGPQLAELEDSVNRMGLRNQPDVG